MKLLVLILNRVEGLDDILEGFAQMQLVGATILQSQGMARALFQSDKYEDDSFLGSLIGLLDPEREKNKTVLTVLEDAQVPIAVEVIEKVIGDLSKPDSGIVFTLPVDYIKGIPGK